MMRGILPFVAVSSLLLTCLVLGFALYHFARRKHASFPNATFTGAVQLYLPPFLLFTLLSLSFSALWVFPLSGVGRSRREGKRVIIERNLISSHVGVLGGLCDWAGVWLGPLGLLSSIPFGRDGGLWAWCWGGAGGRCHYGLVGGGLGLGGGSWIDLPIEAWTMLCLCGCCFESDGYGYEKSMLAFLEPL